jgi:hypothetical protein
LREPRRLRKLQQRVTEEAACGEDPSQVEAVTRILRRQLDGLLQMRRRVLEPAGMRQGYAQAVLAVGGIGELLHRIAQQLHGLLGVSACGGEGVAQVQLGRGIIRINAQSILEMRLRLGQIALKGEGAAEVVLRLRAVGVQAQRLLVFGDGVVHFAGSRKCNPHVVVGACIAGIHRDGLLPRHDRFAVVLLVSHLYGGVEHPVEVGSGRIDALEPARRHVDEFRNVHGAVRGRRVLHQDRRT